MKTLLVFVLLTIGTRLFCQDLTDVTSVPTLKEVKCNNSNKSKTEFSLI